MQNINSRKLRIMNITCRLFRSSVSFWAWWQSTQRISRLKRLHHIYRVEIKKKHIEITKTWFPANQRIKVTSTRIVDTKVLSQQTRICWKWLIRFCTNQGNNDPILTSQTACFTSRPHTTLSIFHPRIFIGTVATTAWTLSTHHRKDAERPDWQHHMRLSGLSHLSHSASSSSAPKPQCSFRNKAGIDAEALISRQHPAYSFILLRLNLHPAGRAVEDWASYWCNTPCDNIAPCCYDNATQCVRECCLSPRLLLA